MSEGPGLFDLSTPAGRLMAATDWAATPIGPVAGWSTTLQVMTRTVLASQQPMLLLWGEDLTQLYNDAYAELIGDRHPAGMGTDCRITLAEAWPVLEPLVSRALSADVAGWEPALQLPLVRAGYREEAHLSVSTAPVADDDGVTRGVLTICSDVTEQVVGERRSRLLYALSLNDTSGLAIEDVAHRLVSTVTAESLDVPFLGLYLREDTAVRRIATSDLALPDQVVPGDPDRWGLLRAAAGQGDTVAVPPEVRAAGGAWQDPVTEAVVVPIAARDRLRESLGVLLAGVSPSRALDEGYRSFFDVLAQQVGVTLRSTLAYQEQRQRAEAPAERDRATTPTVDPVVPKPTTRAPDKDGADAPRVLVADDDPDTRAQLVGLLKAQGWHVTALADAAAALQAATASPPDLLLAAVTVSPLDGSDLLRAIREDPATQTLPVVALSDGTGEEASTGGLGIGADDHVVRPFDPQELVARLRTTIRLARLRSRHVAEIRELGRAAALVTSGRQLGDALHLLTGQVRGMLGARGVTVALDGPEGEPADVVYEAGNTDPADNGEESLKTPLLGRHSRVLGTVTVVLPVAGARRPQTEPLLTAAALVIAALVEQGWHAERDAAIAETLQDFLLPEGLPQVRGIELAASYRPAERVVQVGGDWYDVLELPDGRVALSVGDVAGHGLESALLMGQLRTAVRAYALGGMSPDQTTAALDELMDRLPGGSMATFFLGYLDVATGELTWCSAGHPPPALTRPGGPTGWIEGPVAPPLGAMFGLAPTRSTTTLPPEARLVLYTDGLVERRETQLDVGMPELLARLHDLADEGAERMVSRIIDSPTPSVDDVAVVVVRRLAT